MYKNRTFITRLASRHADVSICTPPFPTSKTILSETLRAFVARFSCARVCGLKIARTMWRIIVSTHFAFVSLN
jgi:hypothetical protein